MAMKVQPIRPTAYAQEKDERHKAEERRIKLLFDLLSEMKVPSYRLQFLKLKGQRKQTLQWLTDNLAFHNSDHKDYKRSQNLINLSLRILDDA